MLLLALAEAVEHMPVPWLAQVCSDQCNVMRIHKLVLPSGALWRCWVCTYH